MLGERGRRVLAVASTVALLSGAAACGTSSESDSDPPEDRAARAQRVLDDLGVLTPGEWSGGSFDFSTQIDDGNDGVGGRVASASWDVYYVLRSGGNGSWGAGLDVFGSPAEALSTTQADAGFFCPSDREDVAGPRLDVDGLWAFSCERPAEGGFYATLDAVEGSAAVNLTVTGASRASAEAALAAVGPVLVDALIDVSGDLDADS